MPASVPSAPVQAPVPAAAATGCVYDRLWSALRPWDDAKNRGHKLKWQSGIPYAHLVDGAADGGRYCGVAFVSGIRIAW